MTYPVLVTRGAAFSVGPWVNCKLAALQTGIVGEQIAIVAGAVGSQEYTVVAVVWGPGDLVSAVNARGGIGKFIVEVVWPAANAVMPEILSLLPKLVPIDNTTPATVDTVNMALAEYTKVDPSPDGNTVQFSFKPYYPPT